MAQSDMPTMRSRRFGNELRRLREEAGLKVQDAAERLECGQPKISQIETGKRGIRPLDLTVLFDLYGVEDEGRRADLRRLAKDIHKVDWWSGESSLLDQGLKDFLMLEADSELVRVYEPAVLPGLLQTDAYMRSLFEAGSEPEKTETNARARLKRRELLDNHRDFRVRAVIDVPALHRLGESPGLAREQWEHILTVGRRRNVQIQCLPLEARIPLRQYAPFTLCTLRGEPPLDVVWLEHMSGGTLLEQHPDVQLYLQAWDDLTAAALSPSETRHYIDDLIGKERES
ncbi:helix-turn-helix domain-containing protein [Streptomyces boncukensis]|uniref:Helix-turn-helix domain-containing protein n=1 Tax=Streptomyces boncukensis TaxID=2711219 RepID=A0A6G4X104_9ACTN|nr:helix-turn-helix transcriptional regulator [Streptomyces boncukensis]NGO70537.1 helix-turn-helix domain-containing protein [Streptomyces boncukensis]